MGNLSLELSDRASAVIAPLQKQHEGVDVKYTTCFMNGCFGSACVIKCHVKDNKLLCVEPDDSIHPGCVREDIEEHDDFMRGLWQFRACPQGHAWKWTFDDPNRITKPMKRIDWDERGQGVYEEISWDEAIDLVATKMKEVREKFGPNCLFYSNEPVADGCNYALDPWLDLGCGCWGNISWSGPDTAGKFWLGWDVEDVLRRGKAIPRVAPDCAGFEQSKLILLWGWNALVRDFQIAPMYIKLAREKGIPVIYIDPIYNWTGEILCDQWIPIRPMTDLAMMLAMAYVLFEEDLLDHEFMDKWVEPNGVEKFKNYLFGGEDGVHKTPEWAEGLCGVPAETIRDLAILYGQPGPNHLHYNIGNGRETRGEYGSAMAIILQAMTGSTMCPGGYNGALDFNLSSDLGMMPMPYFHYGHAPREYTPVTLIQGVKLADAVVFREKLDSGEWTVEQYNHEIGNDPGNPAPNIQMLVFGSHHVNNLPDVNQRIRAIKKAYFTMGWHFSTEQVTPKFLDLVLPALHHMETTDNYWYETTRNTPFRSSCGNAWNYVIYSQKVIEGPDTIIPRDYFWKKVAEKLGIGDKFAPVMNDVSVEDWSAKAREVHRAAYEGPYFSQNEMVQANYGGPLPSWEEFLEGGCIVRKPIEEPYYSFKKEVESGRTDFINTTSGKIEFSPIYLETHDLNDERYCGSLDSIPRWDVTYANHPPRNSIFHEEAQRHPLSLVTPVAIYRQHSQNWQNPMLRGECYRHGIWMNPIDAARRGIEDGEIVRVYNDIAEAHIPVYVTHRMAPRIVSIQHGAWYDTAGEITERMPFGIDTAGACNLFTDMKFDEENVNPLKTTALVQVEKLEA